MKAAMVLDLLLPAGRFNAATNKDSRRQVVDQRRDTVRTPGG